MENPHMEDDGDDDDDDTADYNAYGNYGVSNTSNDTNMTFAYRLSREEYEQQAAEYTKQKVAELMSSPEYLRKYTRCHMCWHCWSDGQCSDNCPECGGYAMQRPCPVCNGKCQQIWRREVDLSHSNNEAHWDGECGLPEDERRAYLTAILLDDMPDDSSVLDAMEDLTAK